VKHRFSTAWRLIGIVAILWSASASADDLVARVQWSSVSKIGTPLSGVITEVLTNVGDRVQKDDVLIRLDDRLSRARLVEVEATLTQRKLEEAEARKELDRALELFDRTVLSERDLQLARVVHADAYASMTRMQADLTRVTLDLEYASVRAPSAGMVSEVLVVAGETVVNTLVSHPLVVIVSDNPLQARALVDIAQIKAMRTGDAVTVVVAGTDYPGIVTRLGFEPVVEVADAPQYELIVSFTPRGTHRPLAGEHVMLKPR
jgi:multidrug efflux system membrane fusion protein